MENFKLMKTYTIKYPLFPVLNKHNTMNYKLLFLLILMCSSFLGFSQEVTKEVKVIKPYEPSISDAHKINELPQIDDTLKMEPEFDYKIKQIPVATSFDIQPIKPAKMVGEPLKKLYRSHIKAGFGTYATPYFDASITSLRSKEYAYGVKLGHFSANNKLKNKANEKVYAGFNENNINLFGKVIFKDKTLDGNIDYDLNRYYYYGYNTTKFPSDSIVPLKKDELEMQKWNNIGFSTHLKSTHLDSLHVNYDIGLHYNYIKDEFDAKENLLQVSANIDYFFEREFIGIDSRISYYKTDQTIDTVNYALVQFNPWVGAFGNKWQIIAGINTYFEQESAEYNIYPRISLHYNIIDFFLVPYVEFSGRLQEVSYKTSLYENPFIKSGTNIKPFEIAKDITAGFKGNISSKIGFNMAINYQDINNQYFYVNDTSEYLENKFTVLYDDISVFSFKGELSYKKTEKLNFLLKGEFFKYSLDNEKYAWHKPDYIVSLSSRYLLRNKFIITSDIFAISKRYAKSYNNTNGFVELEGTIDINLGVEYRYTKLLSAFVKLNNLTATKFYHYNQYPTQGFHIMFGLAYSL
jgi:hypothetical protein